MTESLWGDRWAMVAAEATAFPSRHNMWGVHKWTADGSKITLRISEPDVRSLHVVISLTARGQAPYIALFEGPILKKGGGAHVHQGAARVSDYVHNVTRSQKSLRGPRLWDPAPACRRDPQMLG